MVNGFMNSVDYRLRFGPWALLAPVCPAGDYFIKAFQFYVTGTSSLLRTGALPSQPRK
jgi:hypothetical protein